MMLASIPLTLQRVKKKLCIDEIPFSFPREECHARGEQMLATFCSFVRKWFSYLHLKSTH